jgi:dTDP-4-amino-4,6-dideoxygalactose transaminase
MVDAFEREFAEYTGLPHCVALNSGTAAMHLALRHLGVGPGDTVFGATLTFIGSISPVTHLGAELVFIDSDAATWNMDPERLAAALAETARAGRLPKAVIPTDLYGQCADYDRLQSLCDRYAVPMLVDAAEALGARYQGVHAGNAGRAAIFSFNGNKIITTSGGGLLASNDRELVEHARKLSQQAREPAPHYEHAEIGYNYRMSNLLAAVGRGQLRVLDARVRRKREIFEYYRHALGDLPGLRFMPEAPYGTATRWLTVALVDAPVAGVTSEQIRLVLEADQIESRPVWKPMHLQPVFRGCRCHGGAVAKKLFEEGLCLPSGTALVASDLDRIVELIRSCWRG